MIRGDFEKVLEDLDENCDNEKSIQKTIENLIKRKILVQA